MDLGGAETHIAELCRGLRNAGHYAEVASAGGKFADELESQGIAQHILPLDRKNPLAVIKCLRGLAKIIKNGNFDIVHAHARIPAFLCGILKRKLDFRFVSTVHLNFAVNALWRKISRWGEASMAVSDDLKDYLINEYGIPEKQIYVTVNGIDMDRFAPSEKLKKEVRAEFNVPDKNRLIVYVSRLDEDRSAPAKLLCKATPEILEKYPDVSLLIVGNGDDFENVIAEAEKTNARVGKGAVIIAGARYDINRLTAAADIFCAVSRSALEAMAAESPMILSGNQGHIGIFDKDKLPEAIETNFCCRGCPAPTKELLLNDVLTMLGKDPEELKKMGEYNRSVVEERYSMNRMTDDYINMYKSLLSTKSQDL